MEWIVKPRSAARSVGILPGAFNPPTRAHVALAECALGTVDQVVLVLPRVFPHKQYEAASAEARAEMMRRIARRDSRMAAAFSEKGLFIDIVREAREHYPGAEMSVICGRDAAERIIGWDYGTPGAIEAMLREFRLLVAARHGGYEPPPHLAHAVQPLAMQCLDECSSTRVREAADCWRVLVPEEIVDLVKILYPATATAGSPGSDSETHAPRE